MTRSNRTPGPWRYESGLVTSDRGTVAYMDRENPETRPVERDDNARAIAALPELIDALYSILNIEGAAMLGGRAGAYRGLDVPWHFDKVRAAIRAAGRLGEVYP
jgi:hypothetical protein